ncbi:hypothetical protein PIB30_071225 [Stylosanthes scabra]|uniref:Uncharacterized protein n=1 Tax=Stylosanthes scabra TaxID=79078 RepID=A0ABU6ZMI9_9FABA|nr:hypothetical protein [Stylosanthes scabra]
MILFSLLLLDTFRCTCRWESGIPKRISGIKFLALLPGINQINIIGNKDKQILEFDPEIKQTLRKLRKQAKHQKQTHEISSKEVFEEVLVNMAEEGDQRKTLEDFTVPTTLAVAVAELGLL